MEAVHLVALITGLAREERRDEGRPNTAGCGRRAQAGVCACWGQETRQLRRLPQLPPQPAPPPFTLCLGFLF